MSALGRWAAAPYAESKRDWSSLTTDRASCKRGEETENSVSIVTQARNTPILRYHSGTGQSSHEAVIVQGNRFTVSEQAYSCVGRKESEHWNGRTPEQVYLLSVRARCPTKDNGDRAAQHRVVTGGTSVGSSFQTQTVAHFTNRVA